MLGVDLDALPPFRFPLLDLPMPRLPRKSQICLDECNCYHVIARCTRQLHLLGGSEAERTERKGLILRHLKRVATSSAVGVAGFAIMDNHLHLLLKVDTELARGWSEREVARRWLGLHPPRDGYRRRVDIEDEHVDVVLANPTPGHVDALRAKLISISQFMKELKQEVTQEINRIEETVGSLWAGRFKSKRVVDEAQLLTTLAYIDLNPFSAGVCKTPEAGEHTSLAVRLRGDLHTPDSAQSTACQASTTAPPTPDMPDTHVEQSGWWMTVGGGVPGSARTERSLMPGTTLTFGRYLRLLDRVARLLRSGKRRLVEDVQPIGQRLNLTPVSVANTLEAWFKHGLSWDRPRVGSVASSG